MSRLNRVIGRYWIYAVSLSAAAVLLLLWAIGAQGPIVANSMLALFGLAVPAAVLGYGLQHRQSRLAIIVRLYAALAIPPFFIGVTVGLPLWFSAVVGETILVWMRNSAIIFAVVVELGAIYLGAKLVLAAVDRKPREIAERIADETGLPLPIARLMTWEVLFWRRIARFLRLMPRSNS